MGPVVASPVRIIPSSSTSSSSFQLPRLPPLLHVGDGDTPEERGGNDDYEQQQHDPHKRAISILNQAIKIVASS